MNVPLAMMPGADSKQGSNSPNERAKQLIGRDYISPSSISTYQRCPLRFAFRYVEGREPEFQSSSLIFGGAIHAAIEHHFRALFAGSPAPGLDELVKVYESAWQGEAQGKIRYGKSETAESLKELAVRMLGAFLESDAAQPEGELLCVEEEFRAPVIPECPDLLGRIDLIDVTRNAVRITDFKTSRSSWTDAKVQESAGQQLLYAELTKPIADALDRPIEISWLVLTKTKKPRVDRHVLSPDPRQVERTKRIVQHVWQAIEAGNFFPAPSAMACSTCPHQTACQAWEG